MEFDGRLELLFYEWKEIFKRYNIFRDDVIIICNSTSSVLEIVARYLQYIKVNGKIYVISDKTEDKDLVSRNTKVPFDFIKIDREIMDVLDMLPSTHYFFDNIYRCSFNGEDVDGYKLVGINGISYEDIVAYGVLRLGEKPKEGSTYEADKKDTYLDRGISEHYKIIDNLLSDYRKMLIAGKIKYAEYSLNSEKQMVFLTPLPGTGDIYLLGLYLREYLLNNSITDYLLYVTSGNLKKIADLMGIRAEIMPYEDMKNICVWRRSSSIKSDGIKILDQNMFQKQTNYLQAVPGLDYNTMISRLMFDGKSIMNNGGFCTIKNNDECMNSADKKTILIAPNAKTIEELDMDFWQCIITRLTGLGFKVLVNTSSNSEEYTIKGAQSVFIPYSELQSFCDNCFSVIGVRSGLFDIISKTDCHLVILYKGKLYNSSNHTMQFFGLQNMGLRDERILELKYDGGLSRKEIENEIIQYVFKEGV